MTTEANKLRAALMNEIEKERIRQIESEGWSYKHDDEYHKGGQLAHHAACYALYPEHPYWRADDGHFRPFWSWGHKWDKRKKHSKRRRLIIAAALIVAEIERLDRAAQLNEEQEND